MTDAQIPETSASLMDRLRSAPSDQAAWAEFVDRYAPILYDWCRQWRLQDSDARDVTQAVLAKLILRMRGFRYDPGLSFRRWLWTVARHAWCDFLGDRAKADVLGRSGLDRLDQVALADDLLARLDAEFDRELYEEAQARVRLRVEPRTWEAFRLTALDQMSGAEAAASTGMSVMAVFKAKSKVVRMLREEIERLEGSEGRARGAGA